MPLECSWHSNYYFFVRFRGTQMKRFHCRTDPHLGGFSFDFGKRNYSEVSLQGGRTDPGLTVGSVWASAGNLGLNSRVQHNELIVWWSAIMGPMVMAVMAGFYAHAKTEVWQSHHPTRTATAKMHPQREKSWYGCTLTLVRVFRYRVFSTPTMLLHILWATVFSRAQTNYYYNCGKIHSKRMKNCSNGWWIAHMLK